MAPEYERMLKHLTVLYGEEQAERILPRIRDLIASLSIPERPVESWSERDVLCITYADSIVGDDHPVQVLHRFFRDYARNLISIVHLLPFYPYTSDDGFSITDFERVRDDLGTWDDIEAMARDQRLVFDFVVNHVSAVSNYMQRYAEGHPDYHDFFIEADPNMDLSQVVRPRTLPLLHPYDTRGGTRWLWTTFSRDQVDLNYKNPAVLIELLRIMLAYAARGATMLRLDAVPYVWKRLGSPCIHLPEAHTLVKLFREICSVAAPHLRLLSETNVPHEENVAYFGDKLDEAHMIYNFTLAPLILWSLVKGDASLLSTWARKLERIAPHATYLNITATHDGIGVRPTEGILTDAERKELVAHVQHHGGLMSAKRNADGSESPYELNISYFDALTHPDSKEPLQLQVNRFLVSQAITMAVIGVPGIYIHSLVGSRSDHAGVAHTGRARSINRAQLSMHELTEALADPDSLRGRVFEGMKRLLAARTSCDAFSPAAPQEVLDLGSAVFAVERHHPDSNRRVVAMHNVTATPVALDLKNLLTTGHDLLSNQKVTGGQVALAPYQVMWVACDATD